LVAFVYKSFGSGGFDNLTDTYIAAPAISNAKIDTINAGVIDYMKEGWQPIGGVSVILSGTKKVEGQDFEEDTFFYSQAMVKYINRD
jgi:hypothetical protein